MGKHSKDDKEPEVKVLDKNGCQVCGEHGQHTHTQQDWSAHIDSAKWDRRY